MIRRFMACTQHHTLLKYSSDVIKDDEIRRKYGTHSREEKFDHGSGWEPVIKETAWNT
jgi:hypothetical protein